MPQLGAVNVAVGFETTEFSTAPDQVSYACVTASMPYAKDPHRIHTMLGYKKK